MSNDRSVFFLQRKNIESPFGHAKRGICHWRLGNIETAIADFRTSLGLRSDNNATRVDLCEVLLEAGQHKEAKKGR